MKKALTLVAFAVLFAVPAFARYIVVLKDGTSYTAKAKWTVSNGKALVLLENGQSLQLDPALIDVARSEQATRLGLHNARVMDTPQTTTSAPPPPSQPSLGDQIRLRRPTEKKPAPAPAAAPLASPGTSQLLSRVVENFDRAYDNIGIFEKEISATGPSSLRAELTIDTEDRVFNAISATSYLMVRDAGVEGAKVDMVELFMKTTTGGAAGRFQMTRADADALHAKTISQQDYFIRKVLY